MEQSGFKVYGYRWVMLLAFMFIVAMNQLSWITFASITSEAAKYFQVDDISIGILSLSFMIVFIIVSIPASWVIDTYGTRVAVGIGAALTGIFALTRGLFAPDYNLVLLSQIGIAIGQPFILNALTTVAARWFPLSERATAAGLGSLATYVGIIVGLALTPFLASLLGIAGMLVAYGGVSIVAALVFLVLARDRPPTPPCPPEQEARSLMFDGLRNILRKPNFGVLLVIFFVGLGVFNAVTTWVEDIIRPRGFSTQDAGILGGLMVLGGVVGAVAIPAFSDKYRKRVPFLIIAVLGSIPGLIGMTFAAKPNDWLLYVSGFVLGFFLLSAGPIGFQYGAEVAYPAPEGTSNGLLLLAGQISGIIFIFGMDGTRSSDGAMTPSLLVLIGLMVLCLLVSTRLKESKLLTGAGNAPSQAE